MFHIADPRDVLEGRVTDVYFDRALKIMRAKKINKKVKAEFIAKNLPDAWPWGVFAGLEEAAYLMKQLPIKVRALKEGSVFSPYEPVMEIEGLYQDFCLYETAILGLICQASGIATKAARLKKLAEDRAVISFGARRMHPVLAPMIERNAYIGGCDGVAVIKSGELIGEGPMGTMPHGLILCFGSTIEAMKAYDEVLMPKIKRVALIDTFLDEKFECLNVAGALGKKLFAVRFDTPSSRRGDFYRILEEARWELDMRGYGHVQFYVSGGISEEDLEHLNPLVQGYGIGTAISNAPVIDFAMDIMEVDGQPYAKRGKWSGSKRLLECVTCSSRKIVPNKKKVYTCSCGGRFRDLLEKIIDKNRMLTKREHARNIRKRVIKNIRNLPLSL
ncbi:MAG: nicotinate phosphoribosyltransferase [Nitrospiraceae bacterium]|nr:MAG: nicotinate phosphoribosyltransferase [Nitrospiraceae bacterium]